MDAPVNKSAAPGHRLGGKIAPQARNGAVSPETGVYMEHFAKLAAVDDVFNDVDAVVKPVDHADIQHFAGFVLDLLHFQRFRIGPGRRFFAEDVFSGPQGVNGDDRVHVVGGAHGHRFDFRVV